MSNKKELAEEFAWILFKIACIAIFILLIYAFVHGIQKDIDRAEKDRAEKMYEHKVFLSKLICARYNQTYVRTLDYKAECYTNYPETIQYSFVDEENYG